MKKEESKVLEQIREVSRKLDAEEENSPEEARQLDALYWLGQALLNMPDDDDEEEDD